MIRFGLPAAGDSFCQRLDPRVKILATVGLSVLMLQARGWEIGVLSAALVLAACLSNLRPAMVLRALRPVAFFAVVLFGLHLFFTDGTPLTPLPSLPCVPLRMTHEGLLRGLFVSWQFVGLVFSGAVLTLTTTPSDLVQGLEHLLGPLEKLRVPTREIALMVSMALRFVPTILEEFDRIRTAQMARGADWGTGRLAGRVKAAAALIIPLLLSAFRRADELADAMEARGYAGGARTTLNRLHFGRDEAAVLAALLLLVTAIVAVRICA
jgi:energy-coupling factor transporter transmembrane protein EcfT